MKKIFICSPLAGDIELNTTKAHGYCRRVALEGNIPIAPHVYFPQFLDEHHPEERKIGIQMGIALMAMCDEIYIYGDPRGHEGMIIEVSHWRLNIGRPETTKEA